MEGLPEGSRTDSAMEAQQEGAEFVLPGRISMIFIPSCSLLEALQHRQK